METETEGMRYPERNRKPPTPRSLSDYHVYLAAHAFQASQYEGIKIPQSYKEAMESNQNKEWKRAITDELRVP